MQKQSDFLTQQPGASRAEEIFLPMGQTEYSQWRHHPVTAAFLIFLQETADSYRKAAMDLWEMGKLAERDGEVIRGRVICLQELQDLRLEDIKRFYRQDEADENTPNE